MQTQDSETWKAMFWNMASWTWVLPKLEGDQELLRM